MENLMIFEGHNMEVFEFGGQVLFNPKHVAGILGIKNINDNLRNMNDKQVIKLTNSKIGNTDFRKLHNTGENFLTESGVYKLIFRSHKPEAERFSDWVTDELLPSIRKTGSYQKQLSPQEMMRIQLGMIDDHEDRIKNLESNMVIDYGQQQTLRQHVNKAVLNALGGKDTEAYTYISKLYLRSVTGICKTDLKLTAGTTFLENAMRKLLTM